MKGLSGFDQPHAFLLRLSTQHPRRLARRMLSRSLAAGVFRRCAAQDRDSFDVGTGSDAPGSATWMAKRHRPNLLDPSILRRTLATLTRLASVAASHLHSSRSESNAVIWAIMFPEGRHRNINASLSRPGESAAIRPHLRAESINFFNTPQFAEPTHDLTSPSFGQITNT